MPPVLKSRSITPPAAGASSQPVAAAKPPRASPGRAPWEAADSAVGTPSNARRRGKPASTTAASSELSEPVPPKPGAPGTLHASAVLAEGGEAASGAAGAAAGAEAAGVGPHPGGAAKARTPGGGRTQGRQQRGARGDDGVRTGAGTGGAAALAGGADRVVEAGAVSPGAAAGKRKRVAAVAVTAAPAAARDGVQTAPLAVTAAPAVEEVGNEAVVAVDKATAVVAAEEGEGVGAAKKPRKRAAKVTVERVVYSEALRAPPPSADQPHTKILSWNVAGLRAVLRKHPRCIADLIARESPDVVCLQETKISDVQAVALQPELCLPEGWHVQWCCGTKPGYSGVATLSRVAPLAVSRGLGIDEHDQEGRLIVTCFPALTVVNCYVPNSGEGLKRLDYRVGAAGWDAALARKLKELDQDRPVLLVGDLNCAHQEIDIHNPKTNQRSAGFTQEERDSFGSRLLGPVDAGGAGLVDVLRRQHPEVQAYTYYSFRFNCRAKGIGWRLDYTLVSQKLADRVHDAFILPDVQGSDHVPLGVTLLTDLQAQP